MKRTLFTFLAINFGIIYFTIAQSTLVTGIVADSTNLSTLPGATVSLRSLEDSALYATVTDVNGKFSFRNIPSKTYLFSISYISYKNIEKRIRIGQSENQDLGRFTLAPRNELLKEVVVEGRVAAAVQKGDTTEYNAKAFKTNPNADVEDLVKKMPGITVENGVVKAQGEDVKQVLVDGKAFFGDDAAIALKNLPAEVVDKIQVFDRLSDQSQFSGFDDGQSTKTLNIVTRANMRNGKFGKVSASHGLKDEYAVGGNLNMFEGAKRISILGQANNINQQNFSSQDLLGVNSGGGGSGGGRGGRGSGGGGFGGGGNGGNFGGNNGNNFLVGQQDGISKTYSGGINYSNSWGPKTSVTASYFFNRNTNFNNQSLNREYFLANDTNQFYVQDKRTQSTNNNHRLNLRLEYKIDSTNSLIISPRVSFQDNSSNSNTSSKTSTEYGEEINESNNNNKSERGGYNISNDILFRHRFSKMGRSLSININTAANQNNSDNDLYALNNFFSDAKEPSTTIEQQSNSLTTGYTLGSSLNYTEPIGKKSNVQLNYNASYRKSETDKKTFDFDHKSTQTYLLDTGLTNHFINDYITQSSGVSYRLRDTKFFITGGVSYQWAQLLNDQIFPGDQNTSKIFANVLPNLSFNYKFSTKSNLRVFFRTNTNAPSIQQLQNVINNSNPLSLSSGNPNLKQEYSYNFTTRYSLTNPTKSTNFFTLISGGYTEDNIGNATFTATRDTLITPDILLSRGGRFTQPINLPGSWAFRSYTTYGFPIPKIKCNFNLNASFSYNKSPGWINGIINYSNSYTVGQGIVISSNINEKIDFTLSTSGSYNITENTIQADLNNTYYSQSSSFGMNLIFWKGFVLQSNVNHQYYTGLSADFNQNYYLWNASFGKKLFKKQNGEIKVSVFDILSQNNNIQRNITETYIEDVRTQVLRRYAMLTFTYNLRVFKKPKEDLNNK